MVTKMHQNLAFLGIKFQNYRRGATYAPSQIIPPVGRGTPLDAFNVSPSMPKAFRLGLLLYEFLDTPLPGAGLAPSNQKFCVRPWYIPGSNLRVYFSLLCT